MPDVCLEAEIPPVILLDQLQILEHGLSHFFVRYIEHLFFDQPVSQSLCLEEA